MKNEIEKSVFINPGKFPVVLNLGGKRYEVPVGGSITGPTNELKKFIPVIIPKGGGVPTVPSFHANGTVDENQDIVKNVITIPSDLPDPQTKNPWIRKYQPVDNRSTAESKGDTVEPFSEPSEVTLTEKIMAKDFKWTKIKLKELKELATTEKIDISELPKGIKGLQALKKIIREHFGV